MKVGERGSGTDLASYMIEVEELKGQESLSNLSRGLLMIYKIEL